MPNKSITLLQENAASRLQALKELYPVGPAPKLVVNPKSKWRMVSALQKAIRRGHTDIALTMVAGLRQADRGYMLRRLGVTIFEDCGWAADIGLIEAVLYLATMPKYTALESEFTAWDYDAAVVSHMCSIRHDRTCCDTLVGLNYSPFYKDAVARANIDDGLYKNLPTSESPLWEQALFLWWSLGTKRITSPSLHIDRHDLACLLVSAKQIEVHEVHREFMRLAIGAGLEGMSMVYGPMFNLRIAGHTHEVKSDEGIADFEMIGAYPSYAFDRHTAEGKTSVAYFRKMKNDIEPYLKSVGVHPDLMERMIYRCIFYAESDVLARRYVDDLAANARTHALTGLVSVPDPHEALRVMRTDLPKLNYARGKIVKNSF